MYPQAFTSSMLAEFDRELSAISDALRVAVLAVEIERSTMGQPGQGANDDLQAIMGLGVLISDLQEQRIRATKLTQALPSPNKVDENIRENIVAIGSGLFEVLEHVDNIQKEVYRLAKANLKSASAKINFAEDTANDLLYIDDDL